MEWKFTRQLRRIDLLATIQMGILSASKLAKTRGGIVRRNYLMLGMATLAAAGAVLAQDTAAPPAKSSSKKAASHPSSGSAVKGKEVFEKKCAICHYADKEAKKIGPGLKGMYKRGTFTVNGNKITGESLKTWIENGDSLMPPMKETLDADQIKDVIAYVKTL
jgi:mono/diheme cytochrome c family protein